MLKKLLIFIIFIAIFTPLSANNNLYRFQANFETGSYVLNDDVINSLLGFTAYLNVNPSIIVEIQGHTDDVGYEDQNYILSTRRAQTVAEYLILFGVESSRLKVSGYGQFSPIASNDDEEGRYQNRRVEAHLDGVVDAQGQSVVIGTVINAKDTMPLSVVTIELFQNGSLISFTTSDKEGNFDLKAQPGIYELVLTRVGFDKIRGILTIKDLKSQIPTIYMSPTNMTQIAPQITFTESVLFTDKDKTDFTVSVVNLGGGIGKLEFYNNGVRINPTLLSSRNEGGSAIYTYRTGTPVGNNTITVVAYNQSNTIKSQVAKLQIKAEYKVKSITLHTLIIGVDKFDDPQYNLRYTVNDAKLMKYVFSKYSTKLFDDIKISYLTGQPNTIKEKIVTKLQEMKSEVAPNDYFVFYVSSHGYFDKREDTYYLVPSNMMNKNNLISEDELKTVMMDIDTRYKLVLFDTCHSGKATQSIAAALMRDKDVDVTTISASKTQEVAMEGYKEHGIFTYILANGLSGSADVDQNKLINSIEIAHYIQKYLPVLSLEHFDKAQNSVVNYSPRSFDITLTDERYKPKEIVPVEFTKAELPQLITNLDNQNIAALNNFYAQHSVQAITPSVTDEKKADKFNLGLGLMAGYGFGYELFGEYRMSDDISMYLTLGQIDRKVTNATSRWIDQENNESRDVVAADDLVSATTVGVQIRLAYFLLGIEYVLDENKDEDIFSDADYAWTVGVIYSDDHWEAGVVYRSFHDKYTDNADLNIKSANSKSGGVLVRYKF